MAPDKSQPPLFASSVQRSQVASNPTIKATLAQRACDSKEAATKGANGGYAGHQIKWSTVTNAPRAGYLVQQVTETVRVLNAKGAAVSDADFDKANRDAVNKQFGSFCPSKWKEYYEVWPISEKGRILGGLPYQDNFSAPELKPGWIGWRKKTGKAWLWFPKAQDLELKGGHKGEPPAWDLRSWTPSELQSPLADEVNAAKAGNYPVIEHGVELQWGNGKPQVRDFLELTHLLATSASSASSSASSASSSASSLTSSSSSSSPVTSSTIAASTQQGHEVALT